MTGLLRAHGLDGTRGPVGSVWPALISRSIWRGEKGRPLTQVTSVQGACDKLSNGVLRSRKSRVSRQASGWVQASDCSGSRSERARFWCNLRPQDVCVLRHLITGHLSFTSQSFYRGLFLTTWLSSYWSPRRKSPLSGLLSLPEGVPVSSFIEYEHQRAHKAKPLLWKAKWRQ